MIDLHTHVLPNVDDGSKDLDESLALLKQAKLSGTHTVVCTPHKMPKGKYDIRIDQLSKNYNHLLPYANGIGINLVLGCELMLNPHALEAIVNHEYLCLGDSNVVLVELMPNHLYEPFILDCFDELMHQGKTILLAHPERYVSNASDYRFLLSLADREVKFQINRGSLLGHHGKLSKKYAFKFLQDEVVSVISSDAHSIKNHRVLRLDDVKQLLSKIDRSLADLILRDNPRKLLNNEEVISYSLNNISRFKCLLYQTIS